MYCAYRTNMPGAYSRVALPALLALAGGLAVVLVAFAGGYGYHRDELYFLVAGDHLAGGFADQGPLTPFLAHLMNGLAPGSLTILRVPSAVMSGVTVVMTGLIAFELGATRRAQILAAACAAVASVVLVVGHLLSTTTFDIMAWAVLSWLVARAIRTGQHRLWGVAGVVTGLALMNKPLIAFFVAGLALGLVAVGPRALLRQPWLWIGLTVAVLLWSPWLVWQSGHGWPQLDVSSSVASGGSASSQPRWALIPFQFLLVSPPLAPIWIAGLLALLRHPALRPFRLFGVAWIFLVVVFSIAGGKPYYLAGTFPVLLAAGALQADAWLMRGAVHRRKQLLGAAIVLSGVVSAVIALPILPAASSAPVIAMNADVGETIGWPDLVRTVAVAYQRAGRGAVIFTSNYGEAGAVDRYGRALGLPSAFSGHNAFADWGPPPDRPGAVVVVGRSAARRLAYFRGCRLRGNVDNAAGVDNDEQGEPIYVCAGTTRPWSQIWPRLSHLG